MTIKQKLVYFTSTFLHVQIGTDNNLVNIFGIEEKCPNVTRKTACKAGIFSWMELKV